MTKGKAICKVLKDIRKQIADANEINYEPRECDHQGECCGTCPACESEVRYIEKQLGIRRQLGKAVVVVGLSAGLIATTSCSGCSWLGTHTDGMMERITPDSIRIEYLKEDSLAKKKFLESTDGMIASPDSEDTDSTEDESSSNKRTN